MSSSSKERTKVAVQDLGTGPGPSDSVKDSTSVRETVSRTVGPRYGRPSDRFGPPTALFDKALAILKYDLEHLEGLTPTLHHIDPAFQLVITAASFCGNEEERGKLLQTDLKSFLGASVK